MSNNEKPTIPVERAEDESDALPSLVQKVVIRRNPERESRDAKSIAVHQEVASGSHTLVLEPANPRTQVPKPRKPLKRVRPETEEVCYSSDNTKRGICLIFEHDTFRPDMNLSARKGSEVDLKSAISLFNAMGFDVHVERNLHYVDIMRLLSKVAGMDHSDSDCLAVVMLSHGNEGSLFAYDAAFPTQRLWEPFVAEKAPTLVGKPKLFFLQACQGSNMDAGVRVVSRKKSVTQTDSFASYKERA